MTTGRRQVSAFPSWSLQLSTSPWSTMEPTTSKSAQESLWFQFIFLVSLILFAPRLELFVPRFQFKCFDIKMIVAFAFNFDLMLAVAGSTSLALLVVRLIVSHVLMPQLVNHHADISAKPGSPEDFPLVRFLVHGLKVFDTLASIFSTCWLIAGRYAQSTFCKNQKKSTALKRLPRLFCQASLDLS